MATACKDCKYIIIRNDGRKIRYFCGAAQVEVFDFLSGETKKIQRFRTCEEMNDGTCSNFEEKE